MTPTDRYCATSIGRSLASVSAEGKNSALLPPAVRFGNVEET